MAFIDEVLTHMNYLGYGAFGKQLFGGTSAKLPETDGHFIVMHQTGGFEFLDIHNKVGAYERPTAQITVIHKNYATAASIAQQLIKDVNVRNMVLGMRSFTPTSITRVGAVATVVSSSPHYLAAGQTFSISGATQSEYNGEHVIVSVPTAGSLTFAVSGTPVTPATGVLVVHFPGTFYQELVPRQSNLIDLNLDTAGRARLAFNIRAVKSPS